MAASIRGSLPRLLARSAGSLCLILAVTAARKPDPAVTLGLSTAEWREDVHAVATQLPARHKNLFHHVSREVFEREIARLESDLPNLDGPAVVVRVMRLTALVGDGHTGIHLPSTFRTYPFGLRRFGNEFRVIRTTAGADSALGMRLVAIGETPIATVGAMIDSLLPQDETARLREAEAPGLISIDGILAGLGLARDPQQARFTFEDDGGAFHTLVLAPVTAPAAEVAWHFTSAQLPLYRSRRAESFAYTWLPESKTLYCNFRNYEGLGAHAKEMFAFADSHPVDRLVIDMRLNGGGDFFQGRRHVIEPIVARPGINSPGHLFVLISPITFSAALANAIDFRTRTHAMLVGEPIGEKPNSYSENDEFVLPHSHLTVSYSTKFYEFAPGQEVIAPDRLIVPTWEEFRAGRDPVLEWILTCCR